MSSYFLSTMLSNRIAYLDGRVELVLELERLLMVGKAVIVEQIALERGAGLGLSISGFLGLLVVVLVAVVPRGRKEPLD